MPKDNQQHIHQKQPVYVRDMKGFDRFNFTLNYFDVDWKEKLDRYKGDANNAFQFFYWKMNYLLDK